MSKNAPQCEGAFLVVEKPVENSINLGKSCHMWYNRFGISSNCILRGKATEMVVFLWNHQKVL